jgi:phage repressor protein C with HTH and peptisase S24 domain
MSTSKFQNANHIDTSSGGKAAIERLVEAYGFSTRQALCDHLGVSKSTLANRYLRDTFPADWVIECALETGTSLRWLTTGEGPMYLDQSSDVVAVDRLKLINGKLHPSNYIMFDKALLPNGISSPRVILDGEVTHVVELETQTLTDGLWLIEIEGTASVKKLTRIPVGKVRVTGDDISFDCSVDEIKLTGRVELTIAKG